MCIRDRSNYVSGAILFDETFHQTMSSGTLFRDYLKEIGILPGIKVDAGAKDFANHQDEKITEGLDGLRERLVKYESLGAKFCKWRAVITIGKDMPSESCIRSNCNALARYASLCQENNLVPIVEPEVLINGDHSIEDCNNVTRTTLKSLFDELSSIGIYLPGVILKPSMVISGDKISNRAYYETVAVMSVKCLKDICP